MKLTIIPAILLTILLAGCGTTKKAGKGVPPGYSTSQRGGERVIISQPSKRPVAEDEGLPGSPSCEDIDDIVDIDAEDAAGIVEECLTPERFEMCFDSKQCEHVRVKGINPLPESGVLELSLDQMKSEFCYPAPGHLLSPYGRRGNAYHTGTDIKAQRGDTIYAALPGVVRMSKYYSSYGNLVVIQHYYGFETLYAHNTTNLVKVNEEVETGDPIALAGDTGRATGTHVHFEVRVAGDHIDPEKLIDTKNHCLHSGMLYIAPVEGVMTAYTDESELQSKKDDAALKAEADRKAVEAAEARAKEVARQKEKEEAAAADSQYHTVKSGDTLYGIALKYKSTVKKLCSLNGINEKSILSIGQKIRVR